MTKPIIFSQHALDNINYNAMWKGKSYQVKQVMPIVAEEYEIFVVVTVYVYFFGGVK